MRRVLSAVLVAALLAGCAVGPAFHPAPPVPPARQVGTGATNDTLRSFFDSLAVQSDSAPGAINAHQAFRADSGAALRWVGLLRDTTLVRLVRTAVAQNRNVQVAIARIREYRASLGAAKGDLLPQVTANGGVATQQTVFGSLGTFKFDAWRATADLSWELDFWGRLRRGVGAASADLAAQEAAEQATLLTLVSDVAQAYLELREIDANLAVAERTLATRQQTLTLARKRFAQGIISELDVRQFEAAVAQPAASVADFTRQRAQKENQLSLLLGDAPGRIPRGLPLTEAVAGLTVPDSLPGGLVARRPDVRQAEAAWKAATARIGVAVGNRLPKVTITGQYGTQADRFSKMFTGKTEIYTAQAGISVPLFTGGKLVNQERAARAKADQARGQYEQAVLVALRETGDALAGVRASHDQVAAQQVQVTALRRALQLAEKRYTSGVASYLEVLDAQRGLFAAELALTSSERQYLVSAVQLYKALGGTWDGEAEPAAQ